MSRFTTFRRGAAALGSAGLIALSLAGPAAARQVPGTGSQQELGCTTGCYQGGTVSGGSPRPIPRDDNALEYLQLGGGVLAGIALAGAGMAVATRRTHHPRFHAA
ncbi:MAG TPA: hypothetical protein VFX00_08340 [Pedococcus sp.]|jgi:hypothetical protein|nr:hypothetical protein [Pedococcus sp.]